jgi:hypothetical protein
MKIDFPVLSYSIKELVGFSAEIIWMNQYAKMTFQKS